MIETRRIALSTGITMNVALAGPADAPPVIFLHGFPESHRTWRAIVPLLEHDLRLIMPDLRGFGATDKPQEVEAYSTDTLLADLFALADALSIDRFALVGHAGGAIAWAAALAGSAHHRLGIANSPIPTFPEVAIDIPSSERRRNISRHFRTPGMEAAIARMGYETFFEKSFSPMSLCQHSGGGTRRLYADWSQLAP